MPCPQDPLLLQLKISVDKSHHFRTESRAFLTHIHKDHSYGLDGKKFHSFHPQTMIYCSLITRDLLLLEHPHLNIEFFQEMKILVPVQFECEHATTRDKIQVEVVAIPSFHCDGSCMFLFTCIWKNSGRKERILYTGDFRFDTFFRCPQMDRLRQEGTIDRCYFDDTLLENKITPPTYSDLAKQLAESFPFERNGHVVFLHMGPVGFEMVLRKWRTHPTRTVRMCTQHFPPHSLRAKQIAYLLPESRAIKQTTSPRPLLILCHKKFRHEHEKSSMWIIPTCTQHFCEDQTNMQLENTVWLTFCTHASAREVQMFLHLMKPNHQNPCGEKINLQELSCSRQEQKKEGKKQTISSSQMSRLGPKHCEQVQIFLNSRDSFRQWKKFPFVVLGYETTRCPYSKQVASLQAQFPGSIFLIECDFEQMKHITENVLKAYVTKPIVFKIEPESETKGKKHQVVKEDEKEFHGGKDILLKFVGGATDLQALVFEQPQMFHKKTENAPLEKAHA